MTTNRSYSVRALARSATGALQAWANNASWLGARSAATTVHYAIEAGLGEIIAFGVVIWLATCGAAATATPAFAQRNFAQVLAPCAIDYALVSKDTLWVYVEMRNPAQGRCLLDLARRKAQR